MCLYISLLAMSAFITQQSQSKGLNMVYFQKQWTIKLQFKYEVVSLPNGAISLSRRVFYLYRRFFYLHQVGFFLSLERFFFLLTSPHLTSTPFPPLLATIFSSFSSTLQLYPLFYHIFLFQQTLLKPFVVVVALPYSDLLLRALLHNTTLLILLCWVVS